MSTDRFPTADVPVTLTGEEWTALLARIAGQRNPRYALSLRGAQVYRRAAGKLQEQLLAASDRLSADAESDSAAGDHQVVDLRPLLDGDRA